MPSFKIPTFSSVSWRPKTNEAPRHGYHRSFPRHHGPCSRPSIKDLSGNPRLFLIVLTLLGAGRLGQMVRQPTHSQDGTKQKFLGPVSSGKHSLASPAQKTLFSERPNEHGSHLVLKQEIDTRSCRVDSVCSTRLRIHSIKSHVHISLSP